jgi:3-hydroxybutyryl-CoA dehydrogenase
VIRTVAVIGAGTAGRGFALACAAAGYRVILEDVMPANLRRAESDFEQARHSGSRFSAHPESPYLGSSDDAVQIPKQLGSLNTALTVEDAVRAADLVVDFVPDELESKLEIFSMLDRMAPPRTILLTPSNSQSITDLASCTYRPDRCLAVRGGLAAVAPAHLVHPPGFDPQALAAVRDFLTALNCAVQIEPDPIAPMLVKNQPRP